MESIDIIAIANLPDDQRTEKMSELFQYLLNIPISEQEEALTGLIKHMAEHGTDEAYLNLCRTNLSLAATLPDEMLEGFLSLRMKISSNLPQPYCTRDGEMIQKAMELVEAPVQEKINRNM